MIGSFPGSPSQAPVVLIVDYQEWSARALESVLTPHGYAVIRAFSVESGLRHASAQPPDLILVSANLPNGDGMGFLQSVRSDQRISPGLPIIVTTAERTGREQRLGFLQAGAWECLALPLDVEELVLRLDHYVRAKRSVDAALAQGLVDSLTGLYNLNGIEERARELRSAAQRSHEGLACVALAASTADRQSSAIQTEEEIAAVARIAETLKKSRRGTDAIGRLGRKEFAILAPRTDVEGAIKMTERLTRAVRIDERSRQSAPLQFSAGYDVVLDVHDAPIEADHLLVNAMTALSQAQATSPKGWIRAYRAH